MSDDDSPDNVRHLPRIGSPPPPPVPSPPRLEEPPAAPDTAPDVVRISAFDAPAVPHAPTAPNSVPAALRSDGLDPAGPDPHGLAPRTGALSLAAILAIALAAFEGLQSWIQESGPPRAQAAKHQREMELLAATATADATRLGAEADRARRVPSGHEYGRSALGRGSGGTGRGGGGSGPGRSGTGRTGPHSGCAQHHSPGAGGRSAPGSHRNGTAGAGDVRNGGDSSRNGSRTGACGSRNGSLWDRNSGAGSRNGGGSNRNGPGSGGTRGTAGSGSGRSSETAGGTWRRPARKAVADWWNKDKKKPDSNSGPAAGSGAADTHARIRNAVKASKGPTFWDKVGDRLEDRWRKRNPGTDTPGGKTTGTDEKGSAQGRTAGNDGWTPPGERTGFRHAVFDAVNDRWKKRRERWTATGGPRPRPDPPRRSDSAGSSTSRPGASAGPGPGPGGPGAHSGYDQPRSSPFDADAGPGVTITVERMDPPGTHAKRWEPDAIAPAAKPLPAQSQPALPRAPQRPAGKRPGTTRRKDPIPMPGSGPATASTALSAPVTASVPAPGGIAAQHATDITLDDALDALTLLTTAGMETHDDCTDLARQSRRLLSVLETMADDLATTHNVRGPRTLRALAVLMEHVGELVRYADRTARAALTAAELAETEETAMARDYRPIQTATLEAGLAAPSARIHNEN